MVDALESESEVVELPGVNAKRRIVVVKAVKKRADAKLDYLLGGLLDNVADALFEEMHGVDEQVALASHFNVMRALKTSSSDYENEFRNRMSRSWEQVLGKNVSLAGEPPQGDAASLIKTFSRKTALHYKVLINEVNRKLSILLGRELEETPLSPENILLQFWEAVDQLGLTYDERLLMISLFRRFVMDRYGQVLAAANDTLTDHEVEAESV